VRPAATEGAGFGVTVIDCKVAELTARLTPGDVIPFREAVIEAVPASTPVARPVELIVTKLVLLEFQLAALFRFAVLPSE
jgi:hypothetical protein